MNRLVTLAVIATLVLTAGVASGRQILKKGVQKPDLVSITGEPFGPTMQSQRGGPEPGCNCGVSNAAITPRSPSVRVGRPLELRFDTSRICRGQSTADQSATVQWETGAIDDIQMSPGNLFYGFLRHTYAAGGPQTVTLNISVRCFDSGAAHCSRVCTVKDSVAVSVLP